MTGGFENMKPSKLVLIAGLVSAVALIGCNNDDGGGGSGGTAGTGGTGGNGADVCVGGNCDADAQAKADCQDAIQACNTQGELTEQQCDDLGVAGFCATGTGGTGGAAGTGGAGGDGGGIPGCNESLCASEPDRREKCEEFVPKCIAYCESQAESCGEDECLGIALIFICNEQSGSL
jgi:hypothetical protein